MIKVPFIHNKKDKKDLIHLYYVVLIALLLFGVYKNGILLYQNNLIHFGSIFYPCYFYLFSALVGYLLATILKEDKREMILICLIISSTISINTNLIVYPILLFVSIFIAKYIKEKTHLSFNITVFSRMLLILALLINSYSYLNIGEKLGKFNYDLFDIFLGYGPGGIATTSLLMLLLGFIILSTNRFYKKMIPISSSLVFILLGSLYVFITKDFKFLQDMCNGTIYFSFIILAPDLIDTPSSNKGMIIYGILIGVFTFIFALVFNIYEAGVLSVLLCSIFIPYINKIMNKKYLQMQL